MAAAAAMMSVEEFRNLPDNEGFETELHNGEVVQVSKPKRWHYYLVDRIQRILWPVAAPLGSLVQELAYRAQPANDLRAADIAFVFRDRWETGDLDDDLRGAPDMVVEVLSPSNGAEAIQETKQICLAAGCREFWTVFPRLRQIEVATPGEIRMYYLGDTIRSTIFPGASFQVSDLLADGRSSQPSA